MTEQAGGYEVALVNQTTSDYCTVRVGQLRHESLASVYARAREIASAQRSWAVTDDIVIRQSRRLLNDRAAVMEEQA